MDLFSLVASLTLDSSKYEQGLEDAEKKGGGFGEKLKTAAKGVGVAMAAVTAATTAVGGVFVSESGKVAEFGDNIDKASQKLGISAEAYQEWDAVLQHSGSSIESMGFGMKTLATQAAKNSEAFTKLGLSQEKVASMSREDLFSETITALQNVADENERAQLAQKLFGRSAMELGPLLNTSAAETQAMKDRVHELGGVMSNDAVKAAAKYQDSLQDMMTAVDGLKRGMMSNFLPAIMTVMDGLGNLLSGDSETGLGQVKEGVSVFIQTMMDSIPRVMEIGKTIISAVGMAIIENLPVMLEAGLQAILELANGISGSLPELIPTIVDVIMQMLTTLVDNADLLIEAALILIVALAEGLIDAIPVLIDKVPVLISKLVKALVASAPKILAAAVELFNAILVGFLQLVPRAVAAIPVLILAIVGGISQGITDIKNAGWQLIEGLWSGIVDRWNHLVADFKNMATGFIGFVKSLFGIASPSKVFKEIGGFMMQGMEEGLTAGIPGIRRTMDGIGDMLTADVAVSGGVMANMRPVSNSVLPETIQTRNSDSGAPITVIMELDGEVLGRGIYRLNKQQEQRVGTKLVWGNV